MTPDDLGNVSQPHDAVAEIDVHIKDIGFRFELAGNLQRDIFRTRANDTRRPHDVLCRNGGEERRIVDAQSRNTVVPEFDRHLFVLRTDQFDCRDIRQGEQLGADVLDGISQFAMRKAVGGETVDKTEGVAEIVIEEGTKYALRKRVANVPDLVADFLPDGGHLRRCDRSLQVDEDRRRARLSGTPDDIDMTDFLKCPLDAFGDLIEHFRKSCAGPDCSDQHGPDREDGVFCAA